MMHLAQINIGRLVAPIDDPRLADFVAQLDPVNKLAEQSPGFVWRLQSESGNATDLPYNDDPTMLVNMSVWDSIETLKGLCVWVAAPRRVSGPAEMVSEAGPAALLFVAGAGESHSEWLRDGSGWSIIRSTDRLRRRFGFRSFIQSRLTKRCPRK
jgi:hypothetical protein